MAALEGHIREAKLMDLRRAHPNSCPRLAMVDTKGSTQDFQGPRNGSWSPTQGATRGETQSH